MNPIWRVGVHEYRRNVCKKSFILTLLGLPLMIGCSICLGLLLESLKNNTEPIGLIDQAGIISNKPPATESASNRIANQTRQLEAIIFPDEPSARAALERHEIQAYYLLPDDYLQTRLVEEYYLQRPGDVARYQLYDILRNNLLADQPSAIAHRLGAGTKLIVRSLDGKRETPVGGPSFGMLMPLFITIAFLAMLLISAGYMISALTDEKENRTLEVLITSISPAQLMTGKLLSVVAISLTLICAWMVVFLSGIIIAHQAGVAWFQDLRLDWRAVLATVAIALPAYVLAGALMTAIGATVTTAQETQTVSGIFVLLHGLPIYLSVVYLTSPHSPLAVLLSLLPFTALATIGMRNLFSIVPTWQVIASMAVQVTCAMGALWLAGRALRSGMLRYRPGTLHLRLRL